MKKSNELQWLLIGGMTMLERMKDYIIYVSPMSDCLLQARYYVQEQCQLDNIKMFKLYYVPPYDFKEYTTLFRAYQRSSNYHPFVDEAEKDAVIIIDVSEWITHEDEEFFITFAKYLHDDQRYYRYTYVFCAGETTRTQAAALDRQLMLYLNDGDIIEETTPMIDRYLNSHHTLVKSVRLDLIHMMTAQIKSISQMQMLLDDLMTKVNQTLDETTIVNCWKDVCTTKLYHLFPDDMEKLYKTYSMRKRKDDNYDFKTM